MSDFNCPLTAALISCVDSVLNGWFYFGAELEDEYHRSGDQVVEDTVLTTYVQRKSLLWFQAAAFTELLSMKTHKKISRTTPARRRKGGMSVIKERYNTLRKINSNEYFYYNNCFNLNTPHISQSSFICDSLSVTIFLRIQNFETTNILFPSHIATGSWSAKMA